MKKLLIALVLFITSCSLQKEPLSNLVDNDYIYLIKEKKVKIVKTKKYKISENDIVFKFDPNINWYFIDKIDSIREANDLSEVDYYGELDFESNYYLIHQSYELKQKFKEKNKIFYVEQYSNYEDSKECLDLIFDEIIKDIDLLYGDVKNIAFLFLYNEDIQYVSIIFDNDENIRIFR